MFRRQKKLCVDLPKINTGGSLHIVIDSTGLKVFGEGEWKSIKHGYSKRRTWRKIHVAIDVETQGIEAMELTTNDVSDSEAFPSLLEQVENPIDTVGADGAYDTHEIYDIIERRGAKAAIPPRCNAKIKKHGNNKSPPLARDQNLRSIRKHGLKKWKRQSDYHRRSLVKTTMYRLKTVFGGALSSRTFENHLVESIIKCRALNLMTTLGMPDSYAA